MLVESGQAHLSPSDEQWQAAKDLCSVLHPFAVVTDILQGEKYPTLGAVSQYISYLFQGLLIALCIST